MDKITLKQYKEALKDGFYRLGYVNKIEGLENRLKDVNWKKSDIEKNDFYISEFRSKDMIIKNQSKSDDYIFESFEKGSGYYSYIFNNITYLFHIYSNGNVSIKGL